MLLVTVNTFHVDMYWPTLEALKEMGGSSTVQEIVDHVMRIAKYTDVQQRALHKGGPQTELEYRLAWVRTHLRLLNAIENSSRGVWAITEYGRSLTARDMKQLAQDLRLVNRRKDTDESVAGSTSRRLVDVPQPLLESAESDDWQDTLLEILFALPPDRFERLCQRLLRESNFVRVDVTGRSGDG
ncbi:MAG TPA: winged helix-turn-helix domain-containing protein, partial [Chloroflexota bacterium]|nr:winged helix-turn-helix domain-containing protein [Chloroflexota bacterium]